MATRLAPYGIPMAALDEEAPEPGAPLTGDDRGRVPPSQHTSLWLTSLLLTLISKALLEFYARLG